MTEFRPSRFEILPTIIKNLLIINVLFFLAQKTFTGPSAVFSFEDSLALHAWQSPLFRPWQLITHMFLHGDFGHIFGNMFALWMFGAVLENLWGSKRFLIFYIICGLGAALIHLLFLSYEFIPLMKGYENLVRLHANGGVAFNRAMIQFISDNKIEFTERASLLDALRTADTDSAGLSNQVFRVLSTYYTNTVNTATLGASGAVFGVLAAFIYLFPNTYIYIYFLLPVKAKWLGLLYFGYELFFALQNSAGDNVARWAHIGGAIVGLLIVMTWNKTNKKSFY
ncbi:MAG: rhomboid family intramembrane serine protease [Sediminibacterium sp.]|jgi:membrane associated rhomboid family serine protease|nr:rhomboid family intramembrane serine protease [Chitinophagaceae bacterium]MCA6446941.1 rhomboid family intramembrane serine protease [Chitinophagaceae bacterium]